MSNFGTAWRVLFALGAALYVMAFYDHINGVDSYQFTKGLALLFTAAMLARAAWDGDL